MAAFVLKAGDKAHESVAPHVLQIAHSGN
jgi:hypothetical protein